jgi:signal transduction histidine kinase
VQAQDTERRRIERDIHDGIQQDIVASIARIRLARNQLEREPRLAIQTLIDLQQHTAQSLERLREVTRGIHPLALTHHGLVAAVEAESIRLPLPVLIEADDAVTHSRFAEEIEAAAYFVIREGLTNVIKHAGTDTATVELRVEHRDLVVTVVDNGIGSNGAQGHGSGITGLSDRVESLGGRLQLNTSTETGTTLQPRLPARRIATSDV